ncbi:EF-P 5-aminopentanol modification-associated protein YfmF [Fructobacillus cardui]|uniref:EF-P 5-aminopentanol modification-associated protein YfmF n=1 Tax=Fructobacillus cardui TaxID=2893170 RepID=UPI002D874083|nr:M16 family (PqqL) [Fructobacillus cardui]
MIKKTMVAPGVQLAYQPTKQFKTIHVNVTFATKAKKAIATKRALLSYLMAVSSKAFPDQRTVSLAMIDAFGANFQTKVATLGDLDLLTVSIQFIKPGLLPNSNQLLEQILNFLQAMLFDFDWESDQAQTTFNQERQNLRQAILSRQDDKVAFALDQSRELTFADAAVRESILGSIEELDQLTLQDVQRAQQELLAEDQVVISVVGDLEFDQLTRQLSAWPWADIGRKEKSAVDQNYSAQIPQLLAAGQRKLVKKVDWQQAVLVQNFQVKGLSLHDNRPRYYATLVLNTIFGASPASLLFTEVREKNSLAYNISSRFQPDLAILTVVAGFDFDQVDLVEELIQVQLKTLAAGQIAAEMLENAKQSLKNEYLIRQDFQTYLAVRQADRFLRQAKEGTTDFLSAINHVSVADVQDVAKDLILQSRFVLAPGEKGESFGNK